jgi:hypothetical protein
MFNYWWNRYQTQGWKGLLKKPKGRPYGPGLEDSLKEKIMTKELSLNPRGAKR